MFTKYIKTCSKQILGYSRRSFISKRNKNCVILGIETSCDDTGCAIVDRNGQILGEALQSQENIHLLHGGIIPPIAEELHRKHIANVVSKALETVDITAVDAIAVTTKPGLPLSLQIGIKYAKHLCRLHNKPIIPIHHMEAHALTPRMENKSIDFPYMVLLISGGHCLIGIAHSANNFSLLGESIDDAPGEAFDKLARRMKLRNLIDFHGLSGGEAIELAASRASNPMEFVIEAPMLHYKDCNCSFAGLKNVIIRKIITQEKKYQLAPDEVIPEAYNLAAALQLTITKHLCHRVQRAMEFCELREFIPTRKKQLVVSGGVACNNFISRGLKILCNELGYSFHRPPPKLCTDNGIMIAWNGVEKWQIQSDIITDLATVHYEKVSPLGKSLIEDVRAMHLSCKWVKLKGLSEPQSKEDIAEAKLAGRM